MCVYYICTHIHFSFLKISLLVLIWNYRLHIIMLNLDVNLSSKYLHQISDNMVTGLPYALILLFFSQS